MTPWLQSWIESQRNCCFNKTKLYCARMCNANDTDLTLYLDEVHTATPSGACAPLRRPPALYRWQQSTCNVLQTFIDSLQRQATLVFDAVHLIVHSLLHMYNETRANASVDDFLGNVTGKALFQHLHRLAMSGECRVRQWQQLIEALGMNAS